MVERLGMLRDALVDPAQGKQNVAAQVMDARELGRSAERRSRSLRRSELGQGAIELVRQPHDLREAQMRLAPPGIVGRKLERLGEGLTGGRGPAQIELQPTNQTCGLKTLRPVRRPAPVRAPPAPPPLRHGRLAPVAAPRSCRPTPRPDRPRGRDAGRAGPRPARRRSAAALRWSSRQRERSSRP